MEKKKEKRKYLNKSGFVILWDQFDKGNAWIDLKGGLEVTLCFYDNPFNKKISKSPNNKT